MAATMAGGFWTQSPLRWPEPETVLNQVGDWAGQMAANHPDLMQLGGFGRYGRGDAGLGSDLLLIEALARAPQHRRLLAWRLASGSARAIVLMRDSRWRWQR